jgi:penicillin-binding protein 1A
MSHEGRVVLMVGSRDYGTTQFNLVTQARRQPASTFKAFVFLAAIEKGVARPSGDLAAALARSDNGYAKRLTRRVTPASVAEVAARLGIASPLRADQSIALGASEVTLLELTRAYAAFASSGYAAQPYGHYGIVREGRVFEWRSVARGARIIDSGTARAMRDMLRAAVLHGTGRPARAVAGAAGKTGTSDLSRDAWFVGFTPRQVSGFWVGNLDNSPMPGVSGTTAASVWTDIVNALPNE